MGTHHILAAAVVILGVALASLDARSTIKTAHAEPATSLEERQTRALEEQTKALKDIGRTLERMEKKCGH